MRLFLANSEELRDGGSNDFNSPVVEAVSFSFQAAKALSTHHNRNQIEAFGRLASRATIVGGDESSDSPIIFGSSSSRDARYRRRDSESRTRTCGSDLRNNRTLVFVSGTGRKRAGYLSDLSSRVRRCPENADRY